MILFATTIVAKDQSLPIFHSHHPETESPGLHRPPATDEAPNGLASFDRKEQANQFVPPARPLDELQRFLTYPIPKGLCLLPKNLKDKRFIVRFPASALHRNGVRAGKRVGLLPRGGAVRLEPKVMQQLNTKTLRRVHKALLFPSRNERRWVAAYGRINDDRLLRRLCLCVGIAARPAAGDGIRQADKERSTRASPHSYQ